MSEERFADLRATYGPRVLAYALRHVDPDSAVRNLPGRVAAPVRRAGEPAALAAGRGPQRDRQPAAIANLRQARLTSELERLDEIAEPAAAADVLAVERAAVLAQLAELTPREREALLLVAWDGLSHRQAAKVAGCSLPTFHVRLFQARQRLREGLTEAAPLPGPGGAA
ncbi:sigma factor-like helix-turn-helix DNA-binding protein [Actinoplanes sp. NPDC051411]|uniref:RNA polymerase sigma factor n=1 Tax=Actinoplanes sp. NPDC051411 TaxID=3155522 RepID=UPI003425F021